MTNTGSIDNDGDALPKSETPSDSTAQILEDIAQTRAEMSGTLGELQEKLSPSALKEKAVERIDDAKEAVRDATVGKVQTLVSDAQDTVVDSGRSAFAYVRENPIPIALTSIGLTWLLLNSRKGSTARTRDYPVYPYDTEYPRSEPGYYPQTSYPQTSYPQTSTTGGARGGVERKVAGLKSSVQDAASSVSSSASELAQRAQERVRSASDSVRQATRAASERASRAAADLRERSNRAAYDLRERGGRAADSVERTYYENPLVVGAAVALAGTAIGMAIPVTRQERELLGGARDRLLEQAQGVARGAIDKVQDAVVKSPSRDAE